MSYSVAYADDFDVVSDEDVSPFPSPPATGTWYDLDYTVAAVLAILRLSDGDVDEGRITALVPAAAWHIDQRLDRTVMLDGPMPLPAVQAALERVTIALYHGVVPDVIGELVDAQILPLKTRFGIG